MWILCADWVIIGMDTKLRIRESVRIQNKHCELCAMSHELLQAYVQALLPERERYLHQHALNKARVITRSMRPAEKESYLQSEMFQNTLRQLQRRDKIWQGLLRGELVLSGDRAEFERLSRLIDREMQEGRKVDLPFLRTVEKSKVTLEKAYEALRIIREGELRNWLKPARIILAWKARPARNASPTPKITIRRALIMISHAFSKSSAEEVTRALASRRDSAVSFSSREAISRMPSSL